MKVLTFSQIFPFAHPRHREKTGFVHKIIDGEKIHTIRKNAKSKFKDGDRISLRTWSGKPYGSKQEAFGESPISVQPVKIVRNGKGGTQRVFIAHALCPLSEEWIHIKSSLLAMNDGLSETDFYDWFFPRSGHFTFEGSIILFGKHTYYTKGHKDARELSTWESSALITRNLSLNRGVKT